MIYKKINQKIASVLLLYAALIFAVCSSLFSVRAADTVYVEGYGEVSADMAGLYEAYRPQNCSEEYMSSVYYKRLWDAVVQGIDLPLESRVLLIAQSQIGYLNFATEGADIEQARKDGSLWTGTVRRDNIYCTGNTEYTRWAQDFVMKRGLNDQLIDCDWCATFSSWCMYHAGYYDDGDYLQYVYSFFADPRIEVYHNDWLEAFCFDPRDVQYTSVANNKLADYSDWYQPVNTNVSPYDIAYKPGGLVFFSWDGSGTYFSHVAIVVNYDESTHELTFLNGNSDGQVRTLTMNFDVSEEFDEHAYLKNEYRIIAYADYSEIPSDYAIAERVINSENFYRENLEKALFEQQDQAAEEYQPENAEQYVAEPEPSPEPEPEYNYIPEEFVQQEIIEEPVEEAVSSVPEASAGENSVQSNAQSSAQTSVRQETSVVKKAEVSKPNATSKSDESSASAQKSSDDENSVQKNSKEMISRQDDTISKENTAAQTDKNSHTSSELTDTSENVYVMIIAAAVVVLCAVISAFIVVSRKKAQDPDKNDHA